MTIKDLSKKEHLKKCVLKHTNCPLECPVVLLSVQEGKDHYEN